MAAQGSLVEVWLWAWQVVRCYYYATTMLLVSSVQAGSTDIDHHAVLPSASASCPVPDLTVLHTKAGAKV